MADRARKKTDKLLRDLERRVKRVYKDNPSLQRIQERYDRYMKDVKRLTMRSYLAYKKAPLGEERDKLKKVYIEEVKKLTIKNRQYREIISEFTRIMAEVNQQALDLVNAEMESIYMTNYNQIAVDCKKVGIEVDGEK